MAEKHTYEILASPLLDSVVIVWLGCGLFFQLSVFKVVIQVVSILGHKNCDYTLGVVAIGPKHSV